MSSVKELKAKAEKYLERAEFLKELLKTQQSKVTINDIHCTVATSMQPAYFIN